jgi:hypothetical protein
MDKKDFGVMLAIGSTGIPAKIIKQDGEVVTLKIRPKLVIPKELIDATLE